MSHSDSERTWTAPGVNTPSIHGVQPTQSSDDEEMEDTASSSVRYLGEIVPDTTASSLGLTPTDVPTVASSRGVTGPRTTETRNQSDADAESTAHTHKGEHVSNLGVSGTLPAKVDVSHQQVTTATSSRRTRSRSPLGRALSPRRAQSAELRARFARLHQGRLFKYVQVPVSDSVPAINPAVPPAHDTVSRSEADAALA